MRKIMIPAVMLILLTVSAFAQDMDDKKSQAKTDKESFVSEAASGGMMEVELGTLAKEKAQSKDVKDFGDRMVTDHSKANDELKDIAQKNNIMLPDKMMKMHQKHVDELSKLSGDKFDKAYMKMMVKDHKEDIEKFQEASEREKNETVKNWAAKLLPVLQEHLKLAQETQEKIK